MSDFLADHLDLAGLQSLELRGAQLYHLNRNTALIEKRHALGDLGRGTVLHNPSRIPGDLALFPRRSRLARTEHFAERELLVVLEDAKPLALGAEVVVRRR